MLTPSSFVRFWTLVEIGESCWLWGGYVHPDDGYGRFGGTTAHRIAWQFATGSLPPNGKHLDHLCRTHQCVRPDHLEVVSPAENSSRGSSASHGTCRNGHKRTPQNTRIVQRSGKQPQRRCLDCHAASERARRAATAR